MKAKIYKLNQVFARANKLPVLFVGVELKNTARATYLFGHGTTETAALGMCCVCGRELTHPVSVKLGIGPECGGHYWNWDLVGGYTKENIARLTKTVQENIKVDQWVPNSCIKETFPTETIVAVPIDHKMVNGTGVSTRPKESKATKITFKATGEEGIKIEFPWSERILNEIKALPERQFHKDYPTGACWSTPLRADIIEKLKNLNFIIDPELLEYLKESKLPLNPLKKNAIAKLVHPLYPFQKEGVEFIERRKGRVLIGDEMGLGKTVQALAWLELHPELRPAIIVVPASLKLNWKKEIETWVSKHRIQILQGTKSEIKITGDLVIINYDILKDWLPALKAIKPKIMIADECHLFKNNAAQRTKAVKALGKVCKHVICLSGTPIVNRPIEMFNAIKLIDPMIIGSAWQYAHRYCGAKHNGFGWDFNGATNTDELHTKLTSSIMIRRLKHDVLKDLPDKTRSFVPIELDNDSEYQFAENNFLLWVRDEKGDEAAKRAANAQALGEIEALKQLAVKGKLKQAISFIENMLLTKNKIVIFATHKFVIDELMNTFNVNIPESGDRPARAVKIDGSVKNEDRQKAVEEFQNNPDVEIFVGNIKAAGVGLTLTASQDVIFLELPWTPGDLVQAEDRCHRIGQKENVHIHYLLANNTIEEVIAHLLDGKRKVLAEVLDGGEVDQTSMLSELMNSYKSKRTES